MKASMATPISNKRGFKMKQKKLFNVKQEGFKTFKCLIWGARRAGDQQEV